MNIKMIDTWSWRLIYGGLGLGALGLMVQRSDDLLGWSMAVVGGAAALVGAALVVLRSREKPGDGR